MVLTVLRVDFEVVSLDVLLFGLVSSGDFSVLKRRGLTGQQAIETRHDVSSGVHLHVPHLLVLVGLRGPREALLVSLGGLARRLIPSLALFLPPLARRNHVSFHLALPRVHPIHHTVKETRVVSAVSATMIGKDDSCGNNLLIGGL